ncbi:hypothetical protein HYW75_00450 [Candidatus Pacearchaeota archaeon]|nr:hypothetical protein [Candidatus Pacearchaeota archaeon]
MNRKTRTLAQSFALSLVLAILMLSLISGLTATLGNSRMVLRMNSGDSLEKYLLIKNANSVPVKIEITTSGDLAKWVNINDNIFSLSPDEEKKAFFTIKATKSGTTETKLNVRFIPEEGSAVGLSATVVVIASGLDTQEYIDSQNVKEENKTFDNVDNTKKEVKNNNNLTIKSGLENKNTINFTENIKENISFPNKVKNNFSPSINSPEITIPKMLIFSTLTLVVLLILLVVYSKKFVKKKRPKEGHE